MRYECLYCQNREDHPDKEPDKWFIERYAEKDEYRRKCSECGAAMAPLSFMTAGDGVLEITGDTMRCFSDCPNAMFCLGYDMYRPDCETPGIKQRCLHGLFQQTAQQTSPGRSGA